MQVESLTRFIERRLKLQINAEKSAVARPWHRSFLGFMLRNEPEFRRCTKRLSLEKERAEWLFLRVIAHPYRRSALFCASSSPTRTVTPLITAGAPTNHDRLCGFEERASSSQCSMPGVLAETYTALVSRHL
jgi:hypothetical protein